MSIPAQKVFTLWLSTRITGPSSNLAVPLNTANYNNISWQVDWDSLFRGYNKKYRRCNVKFQLHSDTFEANVNDWETFQGVLTCNLPSDAGSSTNFGTALGLYSPTDCPTTSTTVHCFVLNTLANQQGVDVLIPQNNSLFNIRWVQYTGVMDLETTTNFNYQILLQFELSSPIEE